MTRIAPMRPVFQKSGMTRKGEQAYMDSFRHAERCEGCYKPNDGTIVGAHLNTIAGGAGTGFRSRGAIVALCSECHDLLDGRSKIGDAAWQRGERERTIFRIAAALAKERAQRENQS